MCKTKIEIEKCDKVSNNMSINNPPPRTLVLFIKSSLNSLYSLCTSINIVLILLHYLSYYINYKSLYANALFQLNL